MYSSWTGFLCVKAVMISMKPIHFVKVIFVQLLRSIFHIKRLQYVLMINLGWIVKCALQLGGGTASSEFKTIRQSPVRWESYLAQRNIVTSLLRFAKKSFYDRANRDSNNPDINWKKWWSIVNRTRSRQNSSSLPPIVENEGPIFGSN